MRIAAIGIAALLTAASGFGATVALVPDGLGTVNLTTGAFSFIGAVPDNLDAGLGYVGGVLYGGGFDSTLYQINPANGSTTTIGLSGNGGINYNAFGSNLTTLFAVSTGNNLYSVNQSTGAATLIGSLRLPAASGSASLSSNSNTLYYTQSGNLYTLNTSTGAATFVGTMGANVAAIVLDNGILYGAVLAGRASDLERIDPTTAALSNSIPVFGASGHIIGLADTTTAAAPPTVTSVLDTAAGSANLTPGMPVSVTGAGFGTSAADSATVTIGSEIAPILSWVSPTNLIVQIPVDIPAAATTLTASYKGAPSAAFSIKIAALAPEILPGTFADTGSVPITADHPATPGSKVSCLAIGLGATNPAQVTNTSATAPAFTTQIVEVMIGNKMVTPDYAGLFVGGAPGYYQVSFKIPPDAAMGNQQVILLEGGLTSNAQTLTIAPPIPVINAIVNGATFAPGPAPQAANSFVSLFGLNFGSANTNGNIFPATSFQGLSVLVNNAAIPLNVVAGAAGQINVVLPSELGATGTASVEVMTADGTSTAFQLQLIADSVGIFRITDPSKPTRHNGAVLFTNTAWKVMPLSMAKALGLPDCSTVTTASICGKPGKEGDQIEIYVTGLGRATPNGDPNGKVLPTGSLAPVDGSVLYKTVDSPTVKIGGVPATVSFSGIAPGNNGQYQINVQVPPGVKPGDDVTLKVTMPDGSSDTVTIAITT